MPPANKQIYLATVCEIMRQHWPDNRTVNIVCHGHSERWANAPHPYCAYWT